MGQTPSSLLMTSAYAARCKYPLSKQHMHPIRIIWKASDPWHPVSLHPALTVQLHIFKIQVMLESMARSQCQWTIRGAGFVQPQNRDRESWEHQGKDHHWCNPTLWLLSFCLTNLEPSVVQEGAFELQHCGAKGQKAEVKTHSWQIRVASLAS